MQFRQVIIRNVKEIDVRHPLFFACSALQFKQFTWHPKTNASLSYKNRRLVNMWKLIQGYSRLALNITKFQFVSPCPADVVYLRPASLSQCLFFLSLSLHLSPFCILLLHTIFALWRQSKAQSWCVDAIENKLSYIFSRSFNLSEMSPTCLLVSIHHSSHFLRLYTARNAPEHICKLS